MVSVKRLKRLFSVIVLCAILISALFTGSLSAHGASTGIGLSAWAVGAYNSGWAYVYGGTSPGAVDCSGLIYTYNGVGGSRTDMLASSSESGSVGNGIPNIHGLGLWQPGHVGVYVGSGMAVDARNEYYGVCYESVYSHAWVSWFKVSGVSYPSEGWESFNGSYFYYENGEYLTNTSRTIGGVSYSFNSEGASDKSPSDTSATVNDSASNSESSNTSNQEVKTAYNNGDSGEKVMEIQKRLKELGFYDGECTGYFGDATETAYKSFQKAAGVTIDGIAGESDLDILFSDSAPKATEEETKQETEEKTETKKIKTFSVGDVDDDIAILQQYLKDLGYFNEDITTYFGEMTKAAILKFQKANGLEETGIADEATLELLFSNNGLPNSNNNENNSGNINSDIEESIDLSSLVADNLALSSVSMPAVETRLSNNVIGKTNKIASEAIKVFATNNTKANVGSNALLIFILVMVVLAAIIAVAFFVYRKEQEKYRRLRSARISSKYHSRYSDYR